MIVIIDADERVGRTKLSLETCDVPSELAAIDLELHIRNVPQKELAETGSETWPILVVAENRDQEGFFFIVANAF